MTAIATAHTALLTAAAGTTAALTVAALRNRDLPGATPFGVLTATLAVWSLVYALALHVPARTPRLFLLRVQWTAVPAIPVSLFLFAVAYTGHDRFLGRRAVGAVALIPALVVGAAWTNHWHGLVWAHQRVATVDGMAVLTPTFGPLFWVYFVYSYALVVVAMALLFALVSRSDRLYADQSALVLVGIAAPFVANFADMFLLTGGPVVDYTPVAFSVSGLAFGYALFRQRLLDFVPAARQLGRDAAIQQLDAGVLVVDTDHRVVYCNDAAGDALGRAPAATLGRDVRALVDATALDFGTEDALGEVDRAGRTYELRTSPITDRGDTLLGHTLVMHDVTARKQRERELASQRDELRTVNDLNAIIRGVNQALVSAGSREEIERAVCDRITDADRYRRAAIGDVATWTGDDDRWTVAGDGSDGVPDPPAIPAEHAPHEPGEITLEGDTAPLDASAEGETGTWTVVPLVHGRTVYGALGLYTDREGVSDRESGVLDELGETIGNAINAVETRQLLSSESVVELELVCPDDAEPLVAVTDALDCRLELGGLVPNGEAGPVAYLRATGADADAVRDRLAADASGEVRAIREDDGATIVEWKVTGDALLGTLADSGADVHRVDAEDGRTTYELDVASKATLRALVDQAQSKYPDTRVHSKRERTRTIDDRDAIPAEDVADLTDRQREALEAAYRAGYFEWPRDSTAEDVAETLDVSSATLHHHLRKAEGSLFAELFEDPERS